MADYTHADLERDFAPLGEWNDADTRARIATIVQEGTQATPQEVSVYTKTVAKDHCARTFAKPYLISLCLRIPTRCAAPPKAGARTFG